MTQTGFNSNTSKHLLLDAGVFYLNYGDVPNEKMLGATQGGGEFSAVATLRQISVDGIKGSAKGLKVVENWEVMLTANLLEVTSDNLKLALGVADIDTVSDVDNDIITGRTQVLDTDYIGNVSFVGQLSGSDKPVVVRVFNALSSEGLALTTEDNSEGVIPIKFEGHFDPNDADKAPFEIMYPKLTPSV
jgi:hypothetical protein